MDLIRASLVTIAIAAAFMLTGCAPAAGPASPTPPGRISSLAVMTTVPAPAATPPSGLTTPGGGMMPGGTGVTMGEMGLMMSQMGLQLNQMMSGQPSTSQMQQMVDITASLSGQIAQGTMQATGGTPEMRRIMAQSLQQMSDMAHQMRDRISQITPEQQREATRQMAQLTNDMGQLMSQMQSMSPEPIQADQQQFVQRIQQIQATMNNMISQFGLIPPPAITPAAGPNK